MSISSETTKCLATGQITSVSDKSYLELLCADIKICTVS